MPKKAAKKTTPKKSPAKKADPLPVRTLPKIEGCRKRTSPFVLNPNDKGSLVLTNLSVFASIERPTDANDAKTMCRATTTDGALHIIHAPFHKCAEELGCAAELAAYECTQLAEEITEDAESDQTTDGVDLPVDPNTETTNLDD